jgi:hypothetical protein
MSKRPAPEDDETIFGPDSADVTQDQQFSLVETIDFESVEPSSVVIVDVWSDVA